MPAWARSISIFASLLARAALIAAQTGHPGIQSPDRKRLSGSTFRMRQQSSRFSMLCVEEIQSVVAHHRLHALGVREDDFDGLVVAVPHAVDEVVGGLRKAPGIEHEDARCGIDPVHHVEQNQSLGSAERTRERDLVGKIFQSPNQDFLRAQRLGRSGLDVLQHIDIKAIFVIFPQPVRVPWSEESTQFLSNFK